MANQKRKIYNIRWKQSDHDELNKAVKNFNAKIARLEKKYPKIKSALPERVSARELKKMIASRQDLKRELNALRRFASKDNVIQLKPDVNTKPQKYAGKSKYEQYTGITRVPDAKDNIFMTKWQKTEMIRRTNYINKKRKERYDLIKDLPVTSGGKETGYTVEQKIEFIGMDNADKYAFTPMEPFSEGMNYASLRKRYKGIIKESQVHYWDKREDILRQNAIKSIQENFREEDVKDVLESIENMDFGEFYEIFQKEGGDFEIHYPPDSAQYQAYLTALKSIWMPEKKPESA